MTLLKIRTIKPEDTSIQNAKTLMLGAKKFREFAAKKEIGITSGKILSEDDGTLVMNFSIAGELSEKEEAIITKKIASLKLGSSSFEATDVVERIVIGNFYFPKHTCVLGKENLIRAPWKSAGNKTLADSEYYMWSVMQEETEVEHKKLLEYFSITLGGTRNSDGFWDIPGGFMLEYKSCRVLIHAENPTANPEIITNQLNNTVDLMMGPGEQYG